MDAIKNKKKKERIRKNFRKLIRNKLALVGAVILIAICLSVILAPMLTKFDPNEIDFDKISLAPNSEHIMGTDKLGRDVFTRLLYGGRVSILVGVMSATIGVAIGTVLGCVAGYFGGNVDSILVRISEVLLTFPNLIIILFLVSILGQGMLNVIIVFSLTGWMTTFRMVRNEFMSIKQETFVDVAKSFGIPDYLIMFLDILPNAISPVVISLSINAAGFILAEAELSYLGLGMPADIPTWGNIINAAKNMDTIINSWWLWVIPGITISLFVLSVNFVGDGLRDILDPKAQ